MIVVCSVCKKIMHEKEPLNDTRISHSLCHSCYEKELEELHDNLCKTILDDEGEGC